MVNLEYYEYQPKEREVTAYDWKTLAKIGGCYSVDLIHISLV